MKEVYTLKQEKFCLDKRPSLNSIGIFLYGIENSDGSPFDGSTISHNNIYNNGANINDYDSGSLVLGGNYWGHTTGSCFYTVESGLTPADANRTGIDDPSFASCLPFRRS